jgi:hypothetical protein
VIALSQAPVPLDYRIRLGIELVLAGERARALGQVEQVTSSEGVAANDFYMLACLYSICAAAAHDDQGIPLRERARLVESDISSGLRWLRCAARAKFFAHASRRDQVKVDSDLEFLRKSRQFLEIVGSTVSKP